MKKITLFMSFILALQFCNRITFVYSQEDAEIVEIKKVVRIIVEAFIYNDAPSVMQFISKNYSAKDGKEDYEAVKKTIETTIFELSQIFVDSHIKDIHFNRIEIDDKTHKAIAEYEIYFNGFNLELLEERNRIIGETVHFAKENGIWKIIFFEDRYSVLIN